MPSLDVINQLPQQPDPAEPVPTASNLIIIDNYDSFTWNVYQYFVLEGATVTVYRNDEITLDELIAKKPTQLVVSPGPGHPTTDSGISKDAIKYFSGKVPVFGVCMGQQCMYEVFGGEVDQTGEILHGKTSPLRHDGKGVYEGIDQDIPVTRYHSLAGTHPTLPPDLMVSSWIAVGPDGGKGVIMGVRHKELLVEGVQFHPESILTKEGRTMLKNFLKMQGGTWAENERLSKKGYESQVTNGIAAAKPQTNGELKKASILDRIYDHRRAAVVEQKKVPSQRPEDFQAAYDLNLAPPQISFPDRLKRSSYQLSLMAEIKRASPSKGVISMSTCAPAQARKYALAGASVISVLTEPEWFKGSIDDLRSVRQALDGMPNRPAVLRKEFIFDKYQILEARLAGADTVLLIVKMLDEKTLKTLYHYSQSLGMEPLVEVNNVEEMKIAVDLGSKVIGVNNRNLTNFEVDLETTSRLMSQVPEGTVVCALSGISGPQDVKPYQENGVGAVLVGEALMRAQDTTQFIYDLLGGDSKPKQKQPRENLLVKICGTRTPEAAEAAVKAGADLIGMILVTGRTRCVSQEQGLAISKIVHATLRPDGVTSSAATPESPNTALNYGTHTASHFLRHPARALLVGVFRNQPLEYILEQQRLLHLDIVQLHGSEPIEWANLIPVPVLRAFSPGEPGLGLRGYHTLPLLDAGAGGSGTKVDLTSTKELLQKDDGVNVILAGGLNPDNVRDILSSFGDLESRVAGVDVSSGCEVDGVQNIEKIQAFVKAAKSA